MKELHQGAETRIMMTWIILLDYKNTIQLQQIKFHQGPTRGGAKQPGRIFHPVDRNR